MSVAVAETVAEIKARNKELVQESLNLSQKTAKRRAKHLGLYEEGKPDCASSPTSSPFRLMTIRGCAMRARRAGWVRSRT